MTRKWKLQGEIMLMGSAAVLLGPALRVRADCLSTGCGACCIAHDDTCAATHNFGLGNCDEGELPLPDVPPAPLAPEINDRTFVTIYGTPVGQCDPIGQNKGPTYDVRVTRYVGEIDEKTGRLRDWAPKVAHGVLMPTARLTIMAWEVDRNGSACGGSEVDQVLFNIGKEGRGYLPLGRLRGANRRWVPSTFTVPIKYVRFPRKGANGIGPSGGHNEIKILVDTNSECWCTRIAWISLEIQTMSPVVLLHGAGTDQSFWNPTTHPGVTFTEGLDEDYIPWDNKSTHKTDRIDLSADRINANLNIIRTNWGVDSVHLVAHSKGGLDTLWFLTHQYLNQPGFVFQRLKVLSLTTLASPLQGSILADIQQEMKSIFFPKLKGFPQNEVLKLFGFLSVLLFQDYSQLTTGYVGQLMEDWAPRLYNEAPYKDILFMAAGADMDLSGDCKVNKGEAKTLAKYLNFEGAYGIPGVPPTADGVADVLYQQLAHVVAVNGHLRFDDGWYWEITPIQTLSCKGNDVLVTIQSSQGNAVYQNVLDIILARTGKALGASHPVVADKYSAELFGVYLFQMDQLFGDLRPLPAQMR